MSLFGLRGVGFVLCSAVILPGQDGRTTRVNVAVGDRHGVLLKSDGTVWTWGVNAAGQLGTDGDASWTPVQVPGLSGIRSVAADFDFTIALKADGSVWTWGGNENGQLGNGSKNASPTPAIVPGLPRIVAIAAGGKSALALDSTGAVWGWGYGLTAKPERRQKLPAVISIAAGDEHYIALDAYGQVWVWGLHGIEEIQGGTSYEPQQVPGFSDIIAVAGGHQATFGLKKDGTVWSAGSGYGWLKNKPTIMAGLSGVTAIAARNINVLALKGDGTVWAWGGNLRGELGNAAFHSETSTTPLRVGTLTGIVAIASGGDHAAAVTSQGVVWAWGQNGGTLGADPNVLERADAPIRLGKEVPRRCVAFADRSGDDQVELFGCETASGKWIQICGDPDPDNPGKSKNIDYRFGPLSGPPDLMFPPHPESAPPSLFYSQEKRKGEDDLEVIRFSSGAYTYRVYFGYETAYVNGRPAPRPALTGGVDVFDKNGKTLSRIACRAGQLNADLSRSLPPDPKKSAGAR